MAISKTQRVIREYILPPFLWQKFAANPKVTMTGQVVSINGPSKELVSGERWELFLSVADGCENYVEFGVGSSTLYMAAATDCEIVSVETDPTWAATVSEYAVRPVAIKIVDLGPVGNWGRPKSYEKSANIATYLKSGFLGESPDLVLIDGRFRVASFCSALLHSKPGGFIVFDDYPQRPTYQIVERLTKPIRVSEHQALFKVPETFDRAATERMLDDFYHVMD